MKNKCKPIETPKEKQLKHQRKLNDKQMKTKDTQTKTSENQ